MRIKTGTARVLLFVHLFLFVWAVLFWGKGYFSLALHRHEGVVYELIELFAPDYSRRPFPHDRDATMVPGEIRAVSLGDTRDDGGWWVRIVWRGSLEQNLEWISQEHNSPALFTDLTWVEGVERAGNRDPTLIAWGTGKTVYNWMEVPLDGAYRYGRDPFEVSLRVYNFDRFWLIWTKLTQTLPPNIFVDGRVLPRHNTWSLASAAEALTAEDIFTRLRLYRRGSVSLGFFLPILAMPPRDIMQFISPLADHEVLWWFPGPPPGGWGNPTDMLVILAITALAVLTAPYRYLFYLPFAFVPSVLAWPFAVLYALFLLGSFVWCAVQWYRLGRRSPSV